MSMDPGFPSPALLRRGLLALCMLFGVWCAYMLGTRLRSPAEKDGRKEAVELLESVNRSLGDALDHQIRSSYFQDGPAAALSRLSRLRTAYEDARLSLRSAGEASDWARRNLTALENWAAMLDRAKEQLERQMTDDQRVQLEADLRARGQLMLAELRTTLADLKNPPFEAFLAERRQAAMIALAALCLCLIVALYLFHDEWTAHGSAPRVTSLTAMPWAEEALKNLPEGILTLDEQLKVRWANHAAHVLLAYREGELEGIAASTIFPATSSRGGAAGFVAQNGRLTETARRRDGSTFLSRFHVVRTPQRTLVLFRQFVEERVDANARSPIDLARLREDNELLNDLLRHAPWPLAVFDPQGCVSRLNAAAEELLDYSAGEVKGHPYWEMLLPEREWKTASERWTQLHATHKNQTVEEPWCPRFGDEILLRWSRAVLVDRNGQLKYVIAAAERTPAAPVPAPAHDELEDRLTEVIGYAELALLSTPASNGAATDLERVRDAAEKAIGLWTSAGRN